MKLRKLATYNVHLAKTHLSELLERVADGEEVIISKAGSVQSDPARLAARPGRRDQHRA